MEDKNVVKQPKVIFLDAVGTLFGVRGSVGKVYATLAQRFGVEVADEPLNKAFYQVFGATNPPVFPGVEPLQIPAHEFEWWKAIAYRTFEQAGVVNQFADFSAFFDEVYAHFMTPSPWYVYPDVLPALQSWRLMGIELGIISNFDSRIYAVLQSLELNYFFSSITICTEVAAAKPEPKIFLTALKKHNCQPQEAWHIGDSFKEDYQGASAVGLRAILINRDGDKG